MRSNTRKPYMNCWPMLAAHDVASRSTVPKEEGTNLTY